MINWAKFQDLHATESAGLSDYVYPLNYSLVTKIESIDHTAALMSSDMLQNAADRRFALAQSSPSRRAYNFRSNKLRQMEGAVDTLTTYIHRREAYYNSPPMQQASGYALWQDLAGMPSEPVPEDQISECHLSPSPQPPHSLPTTRFSAPRPISPRAIPGTPSSAAAFTRPTTLASEPSSYQPTSTAATNISHGLSIADLIHPPLALPSPPPRYSPPMTPDPEMDADGHTYHLPDQTFLQATLASIRSSRGMSESRHLSPARYSRIPPTVADARRGRCLKIPRMRRSSQTRKATDNAAGSSRESSVLPTCSHKVAGEARPMRQPVRCCSRPADFESPPPVIEPESPRGRPAGSPVHDSRQATINLDEWWHTQRERHSCDECADLDSPFSESHSPLLSPWRRTAPGLEFVHAQQSTSLSEPRPYPEQPIEVDAGKDYNAPHVSDNGLYAYTREPDQLRSASPKVATYSYGYIAGDVPGAREGKVRVRGRLKERVHSRSREEKDDSSGRAERAVSGVKRRRDETLPPEHTSGKGKTRAVDPPVKLEQAVADFDEEDLRVLREAKRRAERWWKEPLVSASVVHDKSRRPSGK